MSDPVRLSKHLAELVSCSRREAELYIEGGWVSVDGEVVEEPQYKVVDQQVILHPDAVATPIEPATILLHLPPDFPLDADPQTLLTAATRSRDDASAIRLLKRHLIQLTSLVPLQTHASGMMVFSQDWRVIRKLTDDAHKNEHEYIAEVEGKIVPDGLALLNSAEGFNGRGWSAIKASWQNEKNLRFALKNPAPEQIAELCESVGLTVLGIRRIRVGAVSMARLPVGQWRFLSSHEKF